MIFDYIFYLLDDINLCKCRKLLLGVHTCTTLAGEVVSSGLGVRTDQSIELSMGPFRHTKALNRPNYT